MRNARQPEDQGLVFVRSSIRASQDECRIVRSPQGRPNKVIVIDGDGAEVFALPMDWTDERIWEALSLVNKTHALAFEAGRQSKSHEIRQVLGVARST